MLMEAIEKTIEMGGNAVEIEYKDRKQWITALQDQGGFGVGFGIASVPSNSKQSEHLFADMDRLKKKKEIIVGGIKYRLAFSRYESFWRVDL